jgi:hypothetical protein
MSESKLQSFISLIQRPYPVGKPFSFPFKRKRDESLDFTTFEQSGKSKFQCLTHLEEGR